MSKDNKIDEVSPNGSNRFGGRNGITEVTRTGMVNFYKSHKEEEEKSRKQDKKARDCSH